MTKIDLNQIGLFTRVVDSGSFTAAAKQLALPTSSVSRGVAGLERTLGARLLQRTTRSLKLTDAGKRFYEEAHSALGALEQATATVSSRSTEVRGTVRITLPIDAGDAFLAEMFADFQLEHPGVRVEAHFSNRYVDLVEEGFDLALRAGKLGDSSLVSRKIAESEFALFASPSYLARRGTPQSLADLEAHDCLIFERMRDWSLQGPKGLETVRPAGSLVVDSMAFLTLMVGTGLGVGLLPIVSALGATFGRDPPSHVRLLPAYVQRSGGLALLWPSSPFIPVRVALLRDHLTERLRARYATCTQALGGAASQAGPQAPEAPPPRAHAKRSRSR